MLKNEKSESVFQESEEKEQERFSLFFEEPKNHVETEEIDYYEKILEQQIEYDNTLSYT